MTYLDGFVAAVPTANKDAYRQHAADAVPLFKEFGAMRLVEAWGDDVTKGEITDFYRAVDAKDDETIVFSWLEYPDRQTRDAANEKIKSDDRMRQMAGSMPFDAKRMIYAGFASILDEKLNEGDAGYADGYLLPVPNGNKDAYRDMAAKAAEVFRDCGALRIVEAWGDDVPDGEVTDYRRAVNAGEDETVIFSFVEWPDKKTRDAGWKKMMEDDRMPADGEMPFDGKRMFWGGFAPIVDA